MKFFKSNKSKQKPPLPNSQKPESQNDHKSLLSASPSESGILNVSNAKAKNVLASQTPEGLSLAHAASDNRSLEEPALLRPQSAFDYIPRIDAPDEEPEISHISATGVNLAEKNTMRIELPGLTSKSMKYPLQNNTDKVETENVAVKSLGELGPEDVEITEKDPEKSSKMATMKLDMNPFSEKRKPKDYYNDSEKISKELSSSSRVPLIINNRGVELRSPEDPYDPDRSKQMNETNPLTGLLDSPPLEGGILETRTIPIMQDGRMQPDKKDKERGDKKSLSVSIVDPKEPVSVVFQRAVSEQPMLDKDDGNNSAEGLTGRSRSKKESWKKTLFFRRKTDSEKKPSPPWKAPFLLIIVIYIGIVYVGMPFGMFFGSYGYKDNMIKGILNFGLLGFFQGIVQALLLHQLIDLPILTKIREIEGRNRGLINPSKYLVINKLNTLSMLAVSTGLQIGAGMTMVKMKEEITGTKILVSCLCTTLVKGILWLLWILIKSPRTLKNEKKILEAELKEIGQIRKDFMADLYDTRKKMEIRSINQNILPGSQIVTTAYLGISSNVVSNVDVDARKLLHKVYDFSSEFKRIRLKSIMTFAILMFSLAQMLIMIHIIRLTERTEDLAQSLLCVILLFFVGTIFGLSELFFPSRPVLNTMKLVSLIVTAACYRFLFLDLTSESKMIGAAIIKIVYKTLLSFFGVIFGEKALKKVARDKKHSIVTDLYESVQEKEASHIRHPIYVFLKFTLLQETDLFFAVVSLYLTAGASDWLKTSDLKFGVKVSYNFYLTLVLIEIGVHFAIGVIFALVTNKMLKMKAKTITINLRTEFINAMKRNRWIIVGFKGLLLFILLFIFFNDV